MTLLVSISGTAPCSGVFWYTLTSDDLSAVTEREEKDKEREEGEGERDTLNRNTTNMYSILMFTIVL